ncbi:hypothetical protein OC842_007242 [Tilletia horrida]|uniref:Uncharacterized protein n=1 Tax=Tilletia horrida TaxID=155126 RepID=A0AAN6G4S2_9BASI|nr:hypothetical protein OC842_007242 [Tilletia horrida]
MDGLLADLLRDTSSSSAVKPVRPPAPFAGEEQLRIAIKHYAAWLESKGTVKAFSLHKAVFE